MFKHLAWKDLNVPKKLLVQKFWHTLLDVMIVNGNFSNKMDFASYFACIILLDKRISIF